MRKRLSLRFKEDSDTGFGNSATAQGSRLVNADGSYNVERTGLSFWDRFNHFHDLITMKWWKFNLIVLGFFLLANLVFAAIYLWIGIDQLGGMMGKSREDQLVEAFLFSCQTFSTVGYGRINPTGHEAGFVAALESLVGLMSFALVTGLLYGRYSRPRASLKYSTSAIIAPYQGISALMFRLANRRKNQLIDCEAELLMSVIAEENGREQRKFYPMKLERTRVTGLAMSWTIVHPINEESPLLGWGAQDFKDAGVEFIFIFKAFDDTYSQNVHTRHSYRWDEIVWGVKFVPMYHRTPDGSGTTLEMDKISEFEPTVLPEGANPTPLPERVSQ